MSCEFVIRKNGNVQTIYSDDLPMDVLGAVGKATVKRASHVEPTDDYRWTADMSPLDGPTLGPFKTRAEALRAETVWIRDNHLGLPCRETSQS